MLPGYCVSGTVGSKLMGAPVSRVEVDKRTTVEVRATVRYLSFSAHADAKGIADLVAACRPGAVLLVHGEGSKMDTLAAHLEATAGVRVHAPGNGEEVVIELGAGRAGVAGDGVARAALAAGAAPPDPGAAADAGWRPAPASGVVVDAVWEEVAGGGGVRVALAAARAPG